MIVPRLSNDGVRGAEVPAGSPDGGPWLGRDLDPWAVRVMTEGYRIQFRRPPPSSRVWATRAADPQRAAALRAEIDALLRKGAIVRVDSDAQQPGFYSVYFLVPKANGTLRPILDLRRLNAFVKRLPFKMLTSTEVLQSVSRGDWFTLLDLQDAYFHVPIHPAHRRFLRFAFEGRGYEYVVLPFGLSLSPRVFTKVVAAALAPLYEEGIQILPYLDDWLIRAESCGRASQDTARVRAHVESLGFRINLEKSSLVPSQRVTFLGMTLDSVRMEATLPPARVEGLLACVTEFRRGRLVQLVRFQRLLGLMVAAAAVVPLGLLRARPLQRWLNAFGLDPRGDRHVTLRVTARCRALLRPWGDLAFLSQGSPLGRLPLRRVVVTTDASLLGWGAVCLGRSARGVWRPPWKGSHINVLELQAVVLALREFLPWIRGKHVLVRSDSVTAIFYINHQGGTRSEGCLRVAESVLLLARDQLLSIRASHIPGVLNTAADLLSRGGPLPGEWRLHPEVVEEIWRRFGRAEVDLFASEETAHCRVWVSEEEDALAQEWPEDCLLYAFPPFPLLPCVVRRVELGRHRMILVAPRWVRRPWFPSLVRLVRGRPFPLPLRGDLLSQAGGELLCPKVDRLQLCAWPLLSPTWSG